MDIAMVSIVRISLANLRRFPEKRGYGTTFLALIG
jgi:hypothetical protein